MRRPLMYHQLFGTYSIVAQQHSDVAYFSFIRGRPIYSKLKRTKMENSNHSTSVVADSNSVIPV